MNGKHPKNNTSEEKTILPVSSSQFSSNWKKFLDVVKNDDQKHEVSEKRPPEKNRAMNQSNKRMKQCDVNDNDPNVKVDVWFDDVDDIFLQESISSSQSNTTGLQASLSEELTKCIGLDCEMVGIGEDGKDSILARVSMVNQFGNCIYNKFVKPTELVTDYRTAVSGIRPSDVVNAEDFSTVQKEVADILKGRILVGHAVHHDLQVLFLSHPKKDTRDTSKYKPLRKVGSRRTPSLKNLSVEQLGILIQNGEHNSIQDAQAAMRIYTMYKKEWESKVKKQPTRKIFFSKPSKKQKNKRKKKSILS